jgi:hypothetical protein
MKKFLLITSLMLIACYTGNSVHGEGGPATPKRYKLVICFSQTNIPGAGCSIPDWSGPCDRPQICDTHKTNNQY